LLAVNYSLIQAPDTIDVKYVQQEKNEKYFNLALNGQKEKG